MSSLTQIEKALLNEFESLASAFEDLARRQSQLSERFLAEMQALRDRQNRLETHLLQVSEALNSSSASTKALIEQAQKLTGRWH